MIWIPALSLVVFGAFDKLLNFSELKFSHLKNVHKGTSSQHGWKDKVPSTLHECKHHSVNDSLGLVICGPSGSVSAA